MFSPNTYIVGVGFYCAVLVVVRHSCLMIFLCAACGFFFAGVYYYFFLLFFCCKDRCLLWHWIGRSAWQVLEASFEALEKHSSRVRHLRGLCITDDCFGVKPSQACNVNGVLVVIQLSISNCIFSFCFWILLQRSRLFVLPIEQIVHFLLRNFGGATKLAKRLEQMEGFLTAVKDYIYTVSSFGNLLLQQTWAHPCGRVTGCLIWCFHKINCLSAMVTPKSPPSLMSMGKGETAVLWNSFHFLCWLGCAVKPALC